MLKQIVRSLRSLILLLTLAACSVPGSQPASQSPSVNDQAATIVAATMIAVASQPPVTTPFSSPVAATPTSGTKPSLFINIDKAACRSGPGPDFKVIATYPAGTTVDLVGQDSADSYWIVTDPISHDLCWVSVMDATPSGDFQSLPQMTPQPVTMTVPGKPSRGSWNYSCDNTTLTVILGWNVTTGTVNGFRVFRKGSQVADLPASQTTYTENIPFTYGSSIEYTVVAYNDAGTSPEVSWNFHCP